MNFSYPNVMTTIKVKKVIKRVMRLGELALVDSQAAYEKLSSMKLFKD